MTIHDYRFLPETEPVGVLSPKTDAGVFEVSFTINEPADAAVPAPPNKVKVALGISGDARDVLRVLERMTKTIKESGAIFVAEGRLPADWLDPKPPRKLAVVTEET